MVAAMLWPERKIPGAPTRASNLAVRRDLPGMAAREPVRKFERRGPSE